MESLFTLIEQSGFFLLEWRMLVMWGVVAVLLYLAIYKEYEPLLLVPIAFGALLANLPTQGMINPPPGELRSPLAGMVAAATVEVGEVVYAQKTAQMLPATIGELAGFGSLSLDALDQHEAATVTQYGTLVAIVAPEGDRGESHGMVRGVPVFANDRLVFAPADGIVTIAPAPSAPVVAGTMIAEVQSNHSGGLYHYISQGITLEIFPPLIFLGVGALTDFGPLIANPRMLLLGAAAQFGVFFTYLGALFLGFTPGQSAAIGIIGGADGPTSIFLANALAPELLAPIAVAAYSYMALVPVIQPPIMRLFTTREERQIRMKSLRKVGRAEKLIFAGMVTIFCILLVPAASSLIGMLMLGNILRECKVAERLNKAAQNELINLTTIFLGTSVGITMTGDRFLRTETLGILVLGVLAFGVATAAGVLMARTMNLFSKQKINPLIGSAGVSAVPMAARVSQVEGQKADPTNFLLMHAMGPNVAGVIGTALVAGYFLTVLGGKH